MSNHPYLRAYLAGIAVPTLFMLVVLTLFCLARFVWRVPVPIERAIVFPVTLVPNLWGVWCMLYLALHSRRYPLGLHGALLPFVLLPLGFILATSLGFLHAAHQSVVWFEVVQVPYGLVGLVFAAAVVIYYLAWKYLVGFLTVLLGIA